MEQTIAAQEVKHNIVLTFIAKVVSYILHPIFIPTYFFLFLMFHVKIAFFYSSLGK